MISQITARLGLDTTAFRSGVQRAERSMRRLQEAGSQLGLGSAMGVAAVGMAFNAIINNARHAEGELDANTEAVKRYAEQLDSLKQGALGFGTAIIGSLNRAGESVGTFLVGLIKGKEEKAALVRETERQSMLEAEIAANQAKMREVAERALQLDKEREGIISRIADQQFRELSPLEQVVRLRNQIFELQSKNLDGMNRAQRLEIQNQILKLKGLDLAAAEKRLTDEAAQARAKEQQQLATIEQSIERSLRSRADFMERQLSTTERLRLANDRMATAKERIAEIDRSTVDGAKEYADLLADIVSHEQDIAELKGQQADEQERLNKAAQDQQDAANNLAKAEDDLANAAKKRAQFSLEEAARGEHGGSAAEQRAAQKVQREIDRQAELARQFEKAQRTGAADETLEEIQGRIRRSQEEEQKARDAIGPGLREEDRQAFTQQREAVDMARKNLEQLEKITKELEHLGKEPQP